jgi:dUTP pyrophosphatase
MSEPVLTYFKLNTYAPLPFRAYGESAAWDLSAFARRPDGGSFTITLPPRTTKTIGTGLILRAPPGHVLLICSRSGMAMASLFVANSPGVVDPDYVGEIKILLYNGGLEPMYIKHGDRIAQALILPLTVCNLVETHELPVTTRGTRGFGSTGS